MALSSRCHCTEINHDALQNDVIDYIVIMQCIVVSWIGLAMRMRNMRIMRICGICGLKISSTYSTYRGEKLVFLKGNKSSSHFLSGAWTDIWTKLNLVQISEQSLYQILFLDKVFHHKNPIWRKKLRVFFRSLSQNLCMSQSAVKFSGRQNVARKHISNIYNLGTVSPTEVRRISKWPHEQGLFFY